MSALDLRHELAALRLEVDELRHALAARPAPCLPSPGVLHGTREESSRLQHLLEAGEAVAHVGSWVAEHDQGGRFSASREWFRIVGLPEMAVTTQDDFTALVHPADREKVREAVLATRDHRRPFELEHRIIRPDGSVRWVHVRTTLERSANGKSARLIGVTQDVTERRLASEALRESELRYRRIIETTSEGVWMIDADARTTFVNRQLADLLGYSPAEMIGRDSLSHTDPGTAAVARGKLEERRRGVADRYERALTHRDGSTIWVAFNTNPLFDAEGRYEGAIALVTDVTALRQATERRNQLAAIVESSHDAIIGTSLDGIVTSWNPGAEKLFGYGPLEIVGRPLHLLLPDDRWAEEAALLQRVAKGELVDRFETTRRGRDGRLVEVSVLVSPVRDAAGRIVGVSRIARDITERRRAEAALRGAEEQLQQARKMEAVGMLAGGVAHDFNNLLSVILTYTTLILRELPEDDRLRADLGEVRKAGERASSLTRQLLAFSRRQILQPRVLDLNALLGGIAPMLQRLLGEDVPISLVPRARGRAFADPGQIEQVLMNLVANARDAMPCGGSLTLETSDVVLDAAAVAAHHGVLPGRYVLIAATDTGIGMDPETVARIFDPFFTTKDDGKGTGLGLSTVFGIVRQSGGHVWVDSTPAKGTTFRIYLPRTDQPAAEPASPPLPPTTLLGSETVLLVEDDEQVRASVRAVLRGRGYQVLEAANGGEALLICEQHPGGIHLLLTDVVMPRLSGRQLAERLARLRPELKVLYMSGYTETAIVHHGVLEAGIDFLQKPLLPDVLLQKVRELLDAAGTGASPAAP